MTSRSRQHQHGSKPLAQGQNHWLRLKYYFNSHCRWSCCSQFPILHMSSPTQDVPACLLQMWTGRDLPWDVTMQPDGKRYCPPGGWTRGELAGFAADRAAMWRSQCAKQVYRAAAVSCCCMLLRSAQGSCRLRLVQRRAASICLVACVKKRASKRYLDDFCGRKQMHADAIRRRCRRSCGGGWSAPRLCSRGRCRSTTATSVPCWPRPPASVALRSDGPLRNDAEAPSGPFAGICCRPAAGRY